MGTTWGLLGKRPLLLYFRHVLRTINETGFSFRQVRRRMPKEEKIVPNTSFINWSSSRCDQLNDFRTPFTIKAIRSTDHTSSSFTYLPLNISIPSRFSPQPPMEAARIAAALRKSMSTTVYMEMRLSLQKLLFANHPFVRRSSFSSLSLPPLRSHDEAKRGWWYDSDLRILPTTTPWLTTFQRHHLCVKW